MKEKIAALQTSESLGTVDLNLSLHYLGNEAKVLQMVFQSKGTSPVRDASIDHEQLAGVSHIKERRKLWIWSEQLAQPDKVTT